MLISIKTVTGDRIDYRSDDATEVTTLLTSNPKSWFPVVYEESGQMRIKHIRVQYIVSVTVTTES